MDDPKSDTTQEENNIPPPDNISNNSNSGNISPDSPAPFFDLPPVLRPERENNIGRPSKYTPELANKILVEIATTTIPVADIAVNCGIPEGTFYAWLSINESFHEEYVRALENRAIVMAAAAERDMLRMDAICNDFNQDPKWQNVQTSWFDRKWRHREWFMSRFNRRLFGDKLEVDQTLTVNPTEAREQAWAIYKEKSEAVEYKEIPSDSSSTG
jgi:hypothetical protein